VATAGTGNTSIDVAIPGDRNVIKKDAEEIVI
jgi:hypothetical protein